MKSVWRGIRVVLYTIDDGTCRSSTLLFAMYVILSLRNAAIYGCFIDYSVEREHAGLRRIAGYGVTVTRGAASGMMFTYSTLLVTMCRNLITYLRETPFNRYVFKVSDTFLFNVTYYMIFGVNIYSY